MCAMNNGGKLWSITRRDRKQGFLKWELFQYKRANSKITYVWAEGEAGEDIKLSHLPELEEIYVGGD